MTNSAPNYSWRCAKCSQINLPGLTHCNSCAFPAYFTSAELDRALGKPPGSYTPGIIEVFITIASILLAIMAYWASPHWLQNLIKLEPKLILLPICLIGLPIVLVAASVTSKSHKKCVPAASEARKN